MAPNEQDGSPVTSPLSDREREQREVMKPCPFCGGENPIWVPRPSNTYAIICGQCASEGAPGTSVEHAVARWNVRPVAADAKGLTVSLLSWHHLTGIECNHVAHTDVAACGCAVWRSEPQPTAGEAVNRWAEHVLNAARAAGKQLQPSATT